MDVSEMLARGVNAAVAIYDAHRARKGHNQRSSELKDLSEKIGKERTSVALLGPPEENPTDNTLRAENPPKIAILSARPGIGLPTSEETRRELKRRLAKELYRAELDLGARLRIAGKPCDCLSDKHTLAIEATAEELISHEPDNTVYRDIIEWVQNNQGKVTIEAIGSGRYDNEYPKMAADFRGFRKRVMLTDGAGAVPSHTV